MSTWGLVPAQLMAQPATVWTTIFTAMFLHGGWFHILSNMWVLFIFGDNVEDRMGGSRYLIFYLLSGTAAALLQSFLLRASTEPMIGASGAIAGVLGAYLDPIPEGSHCQPGTDPVHLHDHRDPGCHFPVVLVCLSTVLRLAHIRWRRRKRHCLVGTHRRVRLRHACCVRIRAPP